MRPDGLFRQDVEMIGESVRSCESLQAAGLDIGNADSGRTLKRKQTRLLLRFAALDKTQSFSQYLTGVLVPA
jgi:hypothetical protein